MDNRSHSNELIRGKHVKNPSLQFSCDNSLVLSTCLPVACLVLKKCSCVEFALAYLID